MSIRSLLVCVSRTSIRVPTTCPSRCSPPPRHTPHCSIPSTLPRLRCTSHIRVTRVLDSPPHPARAKAFPAKPLAHYPRVYFILELSRSPKQSLLRIRVQYLHSVHLLRLRTCTEGLYDTHRQYKYSSPGISFVVFSGKLVGLTKHSLAALFLTSSSHMNSGATFIKAEGGHTEF